MILNTPHFFFCSNRRKGPIKQAVNPVAFKVNILQSYIFFYVFQRFFVAQKSPLPSDSSHSCFAALEVCTLMRFIDLNNIGGIKAEITSF